MSELKTYVFKMEIEWSYVAVSEADAKYNAQ